MSDWTRAATAIEITARGLADRLGEPFDLLGLLDRDKAELTTDHALSSRGLPVLVRNGVAYGPSELPGVVLHWSATGSAEAADMIQPARATGWTLSISAYCDWCGEDLDKPESRRPGDMHPGCAETAVRIRAEMTTPGYVPIPVSEYRAH